MKCPSLLKPRKINYPSKEQSNQSKMTLRQHQPKPQSLSDKSHLDQSQIIRQKKYYLGSDNAKPYIIGNKQNLNQNNQFHRSKFQKFQSSSTKQLPIKNQGKELFLKNYSRELPKKDNYNSRTRLSVIQQKDQNDVKTKRTSRMYRNQSMCLSRYQWDNYEQRPSRNASVLGFKQTQKEKTIYGERIVRQTKGVKRETIQENCGLLINISEKNKGNFKTNQKPNRGPQSSKYIINPKKQANEDKENKQTEDNRQKPKNKEVKQSKIRKNKASDQINIEEIRQKEVIVTKGSETGRVRNQAKRYLQQVRKSQQHVQSKEIRAFQSKETRPQSLIEPENAKEYPSLPEQSSKRPYQFQLAEQKVGHPTNSACGSMGNIRRSRLQWLVEISKLYSKGKNRLGVKNVIEYLGRNRKRRYSPQRKGLVEGEQQISLEELARFIKEAFESLRDDDARNVHPSDGMVSFHQLGQALFSTPSILTYLADKKYDFLWNKVNYASEPCRAPLSHKEEEEIVETARFQVHEGQQQQVEANKEKRKPAISGDDKRAFKGFTKMGEEQLVLESRSFGQNKGTLQQSPNSSQRLSEKPFSPTTKPSKSSAYEAEPELQEVSQILVQDAHSKQEAGVA